MKTTMSKQSKDFLLDMLTVLKVKIPLDYEDTALIFMQINTEKKLAEFKDWIHTKMKNNSFQVTPAEVIHKTREIERTTE